MDARRDAPVAAESDINLSWLLKLRWAAVSGQVFVTVFGAWALPVEVPVFALLSISLVTLASNIVALLAWRRTMVEPEILLVTLMMLDVLLLTVILFFAGGPSNPFSSLYLVNIALAAIVLPARWTWAVTLLSIGGFAGLFLSHHPLGIEPGTSDGATQIPLHAEGVWVSLSVSAVFIVYFATRVTRALDLRESELARARDLAARGEKLASLATLAAGAAHELSTPLSTIAVIAKELGRHLEKHSGDPTAIEDARVIRAQVQRCRGILDQMSADAGASAGEALEPIAVSDLVEEALEGFDHADRVRVDLRDDADAATLYVPPHALSQALRSVIKNAHDAQPSAEKIELRARKAGRFWEFEVTDHGPGMSPDVAERAGEPFFTTKDPGQGMGLGLFLTRTVLEGLGGRLDMDTRLGAGTTVRLFIPLEGLRSAPLE